MAPDLFIADFSLLGLLSIDLLTSLLSSQKFYKLKREAEALLTTSGAETPSTPSAKNKGTPSAKTSTGKGRKRKADAEAEEGGEDRAQTPSKKIKMENGTEAAADNGGDGDKSGDDQD